MKTIVGLGEVLWDVYPANRYAGGAPANVALHAGQLGARAVIVSAVGDDEAGRELVRLVGGMGAVTSTIQVNAHYPTGQVEVTVDDQGIPKFRCSRDTAFDHLIWCDELAGPAQHCDAVVAGTLAQRHPDSRQTILRFLESAENALKVFDVNFREWRSNMEGIITDTLSVCDIVKMNEEELLMMRQAFGLNTLPAGEFLRKLVRQYELRAAVLTKGKNGCMMITSDETVSVPGIETDVVDTTGCGDAFVAAMILRMLEGAPPAEAGAFANRVAAFVATKEGAVPVYSFNGDKII